MEEEEKKEKIHNWFCSCHSDPSVNTQLWGQTRTRTRTDGFIEIDFSGKTVFYNLCTSDTD